MRILDVITIEEPQEGDTFDIEISESEMITTGIVDVLEDGIVLHADDYLYNMLIGTGLLEDTVKVPVTQKPRQGPLRPQTGAGKHKDKKRDQKQGKEKHKKPFMEQGVAEGRFGRSSYYNPMDYERDQQRQMDYDKREFKRQELQHELGHEDDPRRAKPKGMWFYNVPTLDLFKAKSLGLRQSRSGKWYSTSPNPQADKEFGPGKYWEPKSEGMESDDSQVKQNLIQNILEKDPNQELNYLELATIDELQEILANLGSSEIANMQEAEYQGRKVQLGKRMPGDVKKSKVYVRGPKGNVVKVNFGDKKMKIKKSNPKRRKSFRARHNCDNPGPRWKARYWSCRAW